MCTFGFLAWNPWMIPQIPGSCFWTSGSCSEIVKLTSLEPPPDFSLELHALNAVAVIASAMSPPASRPTGRPCVIRPPEVRYGAMLGLLRLLADAAEAVVGSINGSIESFRSRNLPRDPELSRTVAKAMRGVLAPLVDSMDPSMS